MTKDHNQFRDDGTDDDGSGWLNRFLADEDDLDKRATWRLASWGMGSVGLLILAILATRSPAAIQREQLASNELARQSQQVQWIARESQNKARELAAAVETLNADRDRLYARVTVIEQGLDSVTGSLNKPAPPPAATVTPPTATPVSPPQAAAPEANPPAPARPAEAKAEPPPPPKIAPVATVVPTPQQQPAKPEQKVAAPAIEQTPAPAVTAAIPQQDATEASPASVVRRTEFGVDLGGANSIEGLRAVWRGSLKTNSQRLASMQPIIVVRERNDGLGMQLRLVAGPLANAAEAAKVCAGILADSNRSCETAVYEGQRLNLTSEKKIEAPVHRSRRRGKARVESSAEEKPKSSKFSSFFNNN